MARKSARKPVASENVVTLKVTLLGVKPPVWRRLVLRGSMTLGDLHIAIQAAMGWGNYHLHVFKIGGEAFGDPSRVDDVSDEEGPTLNGLLMSSCTRFGYTYDFGDDWQHTIAFEKSDAAVEGQSYPVCAGGKRRCPPEDCGDPWGYKVLLAALSDPGHPEHETLTERIGGKRIDPDAFDLGSANARLADIFERR